MGVMDRVGKDDHYLNIPLAVLTARNVPPKKLKLLPIYWIV